MPRLSELTDYEVPQPEEIPADVPRVYINGKNNQDLVNYSNPTGLNNNGIIEELTNRLLGLNGEERLQLWPEKVVRSALTAIPEVMTGKIPQWEVDPKTGDVHTSSQMIERALDMSTFAGVGGLGGTGVKAGETALGAIPFLRPALKYKDRLYKGKEGQSHQDVIPDALYPEFNRMAMSGEDISHYNFGFHNDKGHFLDREAALKYGIDTGIIDPQAGKFGALTSTLMADSSKPGVAIEAMAKADPFFSALEHNVAKISQNKMTGEQWLGTLSNKPGVKPEELDWTGLKGFLEENKEKAVSKAQIEEHLANNKVELKEVKKGAVDENAPEFNQKVEELLSKAKEQNISMMRSRAEDIIFEEMGGPTKYHSYQLPGGENYREMLLTLPKTIKDNVKPSDTAAAKYLPEWNKLVEEDKRLRPLVDDYNRRLSGEEWNKARDDLAANNRKMDNLHNQMVEDTMKENPGKYGDPYKSSHWDEPNILAHVRMNDRNIEGKKSLHLEEIQSDWHQQGRDNGYYNQEKYNKINEEYNTALKDRQKYDFNSDEYRTGTKKVEELGKQLRDMRNNVGVPDAPFKKSWYELALKRMIREAAEKGYDRLSWTQGEAQAARYDLSKSVNKLAYNPESGHLQAYNKDNRLVMDEPKISKEKLSDYIGKEAAKKILEAPNAKAKDAYAPSTEYHLLEGQDLKIGGEGMKGFYDQIIPKALEKIGKEHEVKVKSGKLPMDNEKLGYAEILHRVGMTNDEWKALTPVQRADKLAKHNIGQPIHYIDIPKSLRDTAMHKGFPLFSSTHMFIPVDHEPEFKK